jgi:hypothetical protein
MKSVFFVLLAVGIALPAVAYNPVTVDPERAYEVITIETAPIVKQEFLGTLEEYPEMFEFTTSEAMTLRAQVWQRYSDTPAPLAFIAVRQDDRGGGVTEVSRVKQNPSDWDVVREGVLGMKFLQSGVMERQIEPGTYRIEVSSPVNQGDYLLVLGTEDDSVNFFSMIGNIWSTQQHFGHWPFRMLLSSYVYYPIGIGILLFAFYLTHQYRRGKQVWLIHWLKRSS